MDLLQQEIKEEIEFYLKLSTKPDLCDRLTEVPKEAQEALYNFIGVQQYSKVQKTVIAFQVKEDVYALLNGKQAEFSWTFVV
jgi:hypothetical protein